MHVQSQKPATVDAAIDLAIQMDAILRDADRDDTQSHRYGKRGNGYSNGFRSANSYSSNYSRNSAFNGSNRTGPTPMELGAAELKHQGKQHAPRQHLNRHSQQSRNSSDPTRMRCYNCNQLGHPAKLCPEKKRSGNHRQRRQ